MAPHDSQDYRALTSSTIENGGGSARAGCDLEPRSARVEKWTHASFTAQRNATARRILAIRGKRVILDSGLPSYTGVTTKRLNEQVGRNPGRFPADIAFVLWAPWWESLRSQFATLKPGRGQHRKFLPMFRRAQLADGPTSKLIACFAAQRSAPGPSWELEVKGKMNADVNVELEHIGHAMVATLNGDRGGAAPPVLKHG